jgi:hypothetical protein
MMKNRLALLTALAVDNVGSGFFLPLALLYVTRVVDRVGPRLVVISAQLLQAPGAVTLLQYADEARETPAVPPKGDRARPGHPAHLVPYYA